MKTLLFSLALLFTLSITSCGGGVENDPQVIANKVCELNKKIKAATADAKLKIQAELMLYISDYSKNHKEDKPFLQNVAGLIAECNKDS